jgi:hypothetical protein
MRWIYSVCFENPESRPPVTVRGTCEANRAHTGVQRAVREASLRHKGLRYSSLNVTLERTGPEEAEPDGEETDT